MARRLSAGRMGCQTLTRSGTGASVIKRKQRLAKLLARGGEAMYKNRLSSVPEPDRNRKVTVEIVRRVMDGCAAGVGERGADAGAEAVVSGTGS